MGLMFQYWISVELNHLSLCDKWLLGQLEHPYNDNIQIDNSNCQLNQFLFAYHINKSINMESSGHTRPARSKQRKLKVFPLVQTELAVLGFDSDLSMQPHRLNAKILMGFLILGSSSACIFEYTFCEANSFAEYTESSYMGSYMLTIAFALLILVLKRKEIFALINDCECVINTSKTK